MPHAMDLELCLNGKLIEMVERRDYGLRIALDDEGDEVGIEPSFDLVTGRLQLNIHLVDVIKDGEGPITATIIIPCRGQIPI